MLGLLIHRTDRGDAGKLAEALEFVPTEDLRLVDAAEAEWERQAELTRQQNRRDDQRALVAVMVALPISTVLVAVLANAVLLMGDGAVGRAMAFVTFIPSTAIGLLAARTTVRHFFDK